MKSIFIPAVVVILVGGCAGKFTYMPPTQTYEAINSVAVNKPRADVWKKIIPSLGGSFFVINNLDKESGLINVSYSGNPQKYVDCGVIDSSVKDNQGRKTYNFPAASAYVEYETMHDGQNLLFIKRKMNLECRIKVIVQEMSATSTQVTVDTKYVLTKDVLISNPQGLNHNANDSISFNTNGSASFPEQITCYATGALEHEVLSLFGI